MNQTMSWENVYIFISSTFNDMHAERDYLVKRVFPELRLWCSKRRLKLVDIDLRWGVSEKDATENKRVIDVCLKNIDKCRPFFLCFLGQRRGWIPTKDDVNPTTYQNYPDLEQYLGKNSVTELEIIHALLHPLDHKNSSVDHAFFYYRKPDYLLDISSTKLRELFSPKGVDTELETFKEGLQTTYPISFYDAQWNSQKISPELINVMGEDLSKGRLENFIVEEQTLKSSILQQLKSAIEAEFPGRDELFCASTSLELELLSQDNFLFQACDSYIPRPNEEEKILAYLNSSQHTPYILQADAGAGKTSMLAHLISEDKISGQIFYRFAGISAESLDSQHTLQKLAEEMISCGFLTKSELDKVENNLLMSFPNLIKTAARRGSFTIIIDGIDQWTRAAEDILWIPQSLPENVKMILSIKANGDEKLTNALLRRGFTMEKLREMSSHEEKTLFIQQYLSQFLKDISDEQIEHLLALSGTNNPLYLKIVLNELRIHGSFDTLLNQLKKDYGQTPSDAFASVLERLETEEYHPLIPPSVFTMVFLGILAYALEAIDIKTYKEVFLNLYADEMEKEGIFLDEDEIMDSVYTLARHLSPYLVVDGDRISFLYDSFRTASKKRYKAYASALHTFLFSMYFDYSKNDDETYSFDNLNSSEIKCMTYHALHASESIFMNLITDAFFIHALVKKAGALHVSQILNEAVSMNYCSAELKEISKCILSNSVKLNANPDTLFYEFKKGIASSNIIVKNWLEQAVAEMDLVYFSPVTRKEITTAIPSHEIAYKDFSVSTKKYPIEDNLVYVTLPVAPKNSDCPNSVIYIQNLETEEMEISYELPYAVSRCHVDQNDLYIEARENTDGKTKIEIYRIPSLECIFSKENLPKLPEDFYWQKHCHGYHGDLYEIALSKSTPLQARVYRLNDGKVLHETLFPKDCTTLSVDYKFFGPFLSEHNKDNGSLKLWFLPTNTLLLEETTKINPYIGTIDGNLFYYCQKYEGKKVYQYQFNDSSVILLKQSQLESKTDFSIEFAEAELGHLFVIDYNNGLHVYDKNLQYKGYLKNGFGFSATTAQPIFYHWKNHLQLVERNRLHFYQLEELLSSLSLDSDDKKTCLYRYPFINGDYLYLLDAYSQKIHIGTLQCTSEDISTQRRYFLEGSKPQSPKWIYQIGDREYVLGYTSFAHFTDSSHYENRYTVTLKSMDSLKTALQYTNKIPDGYDLAGAYFDQGNLGIIFQVKYGSEEYKNTQIHTLSVSKKIQSVDIWELDLNYDSHAVISIDKTNNYLFCFGCDVDDSTKAIQIYDLHTKERILTHTHSFGLSISTSNILVNGEWIYCTANIRGMDNCILLEINPNTKEIRENTVTTKEIGSVKMVTVTEKSIYFYARFKHILYQYSLESHSFTLILDVKDQPGCLSILEKYNCILKFDSDGMCDVYDVESGKHIMHQLFPHEIEHVLDCPNKPWFYAGTKNQEYNFYGLTSIEHLLS